jgi:Icc protein
MNRRAFLTSAAVGAALSQRAAASDSFRFVHMTDLHIQPELRAAEGCRACIQRVNGLDPDFVISGGDQVFDAAETALPRAKLVYDLYRETIKPLTKPVHHVIGNHDVFGVGLASGVTPSDPLYGKRIFEDRIGKRYFSFVHKNWQFFFLDSIFLTGHSFVGRIDDDQLSWLQSELKSTPADRPLVLITHVPLVTAFPQYATSPAPPETLHVVNAREVLEMFRPLNLKAVLQGHTHVREKVVYNGCQFITSGAVCGNWWRGARFGHPEGFGLLTVHNDELSWEYLTYGFRAAG